MANCYEHREYISEDINLDFHSKRVVPSPEKCAKCKHEIMWGDKTQRYRGKIYHSKCLHKMLQNSRGWI
jgi:hypothetical protein